MIYWLLQYDKARRTRITPVSEADV